MWFMALQIRAKTGLGRPACGGGRRQRMMNAQTGAVFKEGGGHLTPSARLGKLEVWAGAGYSRKFLTSPIHVKDD
jgi:hypothetical protein